MAGAAGQRMPRSKPGALPLGDAPTSLQVKLAGAAGFEPTDAKPGALPLGDAPNL